jgi:peptidoglycan/xylan/chitin deacetylase (PgdA/CDA1 family)
MADCQPSPLIRASYAVHAGAGVLALAGQWPLALGAVAANHALITAAGLLPRSSLLGPNLTRLPAAAAVRNEVALTIDDGPDPEVTPRVLDLLDAANAKATFFCIGQAVTRHAALAREMVVRGHGVENHSQHHLKLFALLGPWRMRREVVDAQKSIADTVGRLPHYFRPTAGFRNPFLDSILRDLDLRLVTWTRRPFDTRCGDAAVVLARLTRGLAAGNILLMHDGNSTLTAAGQPVILTALPRLLDAGKAAGLRFVTLDHALQAP